MEFRYQNLNSDKSVGRPKKIESVEELQACVNGYFKEVEEQEKPPTMSGLARHCGFKSRSSLLRYRDDPDTRYQEILDEAKLRVEEYSEERLHTARNASGAIFSLKNIGDGWEDRNALDTNMSAQVRIEDIIFSAEDSESENM